MQRRQQSTDDESMDPSGEDGQQQMAPFWRRRESWRLLLPLLCGLALFAAGWTVWGRYRDLVRRL
jgi:hypothetical protein